MFFCPALLRSCRHSLVASLVLFASAASAQTFSLSMQFHAFDFAIVDDTKGYICSIEHDGPSRESNVLLQEVSLPSGDLGPPVLVKHVPWASSTGAWGAQTCSVQPVPEEDAVVVAYSFAPTSANVIYHETVIYNTGDGTLTDRIESLDTLSTALPQVVVRRIGDAFYLFIRAAATGRLRAYGFESFSDLQAGDSQGWFFPGLLGPTDPPRAYPGTFDAVVINDIPGDPELRVAFAQAEVPDTSRVVFGTVDENFNADGMDYVEHVAQTGDAVGTSARAFAHTYFNQATGQTTFLHFPPPFTSMLPPMLLHLTDDGELTILNWDDEITPFPFTMDALLYEGTDWIVAARDETTSKLRIHRFPAAYTEAEGAPPFDATGTLVDSVFCGTEESSGVFGYSNRDDNNFVSIVESPGGLLAVAHVVCTDPDVDRELKVLTVDPDFPDADLEVTVDDGVTVAFGGETLTYSVVVQNVGPDANNHVQVADSFPAELTCDWTSAASGGATGNGSGSGDLLETLALPSGSSVTYTVVCTILDGATTLLSNTASVSSPSVDPDDTNNSATDDDTLIVPSDADTDGDGLTDLEESLIGTDRLNPDSDDDGIQDNVDPEPTVPSNICLGDNALLDNEIIATQLVCAARASIDVGPAVEVELGGELTLFAPFVSMNGGFVVLTGGDVTVLSDDPCPVCP